MTFKNTFLFSVLICSILFAQCKKDEKEDPTPTPVTPNDPVAPATIALVFAQNGVPAASGQANMAITQSVTLSGVKISIPSNSFVNASTGAVITGVVDLSVKGIFSKSDIILTGAPANAAGKLISTKGCIKVSASQNSQTLRLNTGSNVVVNVPEPGSTPVTNIKKYYAHQISVSDSTKIWRPSTDTASLVAQFDTASNKYYYQARLDSVAWLNTGYEWDTIATKTTVSATLDTSYTSTNCTVYLSLNGKLVVGAMYPQGGGYFTINNIPVGINVNFVVIAVKNGVYYSVVTPATIISNHFQSLTPQSTTLSSIQTQLAQLP